MKICIYAAGAIGGYLGAQLARAGADVSLVARRAHLAAMRENGLKLLIGEETDVVRPRCTDNPIELGVQDFIIVWLKAHSIPLVLDQMRPLLGPRTRIVTAVNGIPYKYFYRHGRAYENTILERVDPGGRQWRELGPERAIGCIVFPATEIEAPGIIRHLYGNHFPLRRALRRDHGPTSSCFLICSPPPV
jgi:2-dehydropantoate 2-reductase